MATVAEDDAVDKSRASVYEFQYLDLFAKEFEVGTSDLELTEEESAAREEWCQLRRAFVKNRSVRFNGECWSQEELLKNCVLPPTFKAKKVSKRSIIAEPRSKRYYPPLLVPWEGFESACTTELFSTEELEAPLNSSEYLSKIYDPIMADEADEHAFLKHCVFTKLENCGLLTGLTLQETGAPRGVVYNGRPDDVGVHEPENIVSSIIEVKSSQNLMIPNDAMEVCKRYKQAFDNQVQMRSENRSVDWSRIGYPLAQMLGYMIDNSVPYGALCSASKTYFVRLVITTDEKGGSTITVEITKAWITCEMHYLRAWAAFFRFSNQNSGILKGRNLNEEVSKNGWELCTPLHRPQSRSRVAVAAPKDEDDNDSVDKGGDDEQDDDENNGRSGGNTKSSRQSWLGQAVKTFKRGRNKGSQGSGLGKKAKGTDGDGRKAHSGDVPEHAVLPPLVRYETPSSLDFEFELDFVPFVKYEYLRQKKYISESRNGVVFSAEVHGKVYAVKQFDLSKNFGGYEREILAYKHLRGAWGDLVPTPQFLSASPTGNVRFLGMTMGDVPMQKVTSDDVQEIQKKLSDNFHFRHLDNSHGRNYITVGGKLMMIDFEEWKNLESSSAETL